MRLGNTSRAKRKMQKAINRINSFTPWFPRQNYFYHDTSRFVWQIAASQSGKTETAVPKFLRRIIQSQKLLREKHGRYIDRPYWIVVPTRDVAIPVKDKMGKYLPRSSGLIDEKAQGKSTAFWRQTDGAGAAFLKYGAQIHFKSFDQGERLVAASLGGLWADECARMDDVDVWQNLFARLKETKGWVLGTSSPAKRAGFYSNIYKRYQHNPEHSWLKWTSYDSASSPHSTITIEEIERAKASMPAHSFAREYLAEWASAEGQVYTGFDWERNVVKMLPMVAEHKYVIGVDVGMSHPTTFVVVRFDGSQFVVVQEQTLENVGIREIVKELAKMYLKYKPKNIYYDYGGGGVFVNREWETFWSERRRNGIDAFDPAVSARFDAECRRAELCLEQAWKGPSSVNDGIAMVNAAFASPGSPLLVGDQCKRLLDEIDEYVWSDNPEKDAPVKENDDHVDALRYAIVTYVLQYLDSKKTKDLFGVAA